MFSGQGSQYYNMGKELFCQNSIFRHWMLKLNDTVYQNLGLSIIDEIYNKEKRMADKFDRLLYSHTAIFMVEYSLAYLLIESGIEPDYVLGTSLGEFTSAAVGGAISVEKALECLIKQAELIERYCKNGNMIAIIDNWELYEHSTLISRNSELAAVNYANHFIISGDSEKLATIEAYLRGNNILYQSLPTRYGFHSSNIDGIEKEYKNFLADYSFTNSQIPMISCLLQDYIAELPQNYFWNVVRQPIYFQQTLCKCEKENPNIYIDLGPSGTLANFVKKNLNPNSTSQVYDAINPFGQDVKQFEKIKQNLILS